MRVKLLFFIIFFFFVSGHYNFLPIRTARGIYVLIQRNTRARVHNRRHRYVFINARGRYQSRLIDRRRRSRSWINNNMIRLNWFSYRANIACVWEPTDRTHTHAEIFHESLLAVFSDPRDGSQWHTRARNFMQSIPDEIIFIHLHTSFNDFFLTTWSSDRSLVVNMSFYSLCF